MSARQYIRVLAINALARRAVGVGDNVFGKETVEDIKNTDPQLHALMMKVESACAELDEYAITKCERRANERPSHQD